MVSVLAFNSDDPRSNPAEAYSFSVKYVFENKQKDAGLTHYLIKGYQSINARKLDHLINKILSSFITETHHSNPVLPIAQEYSGE